ncbi:hypothetical protein ABZZ74_38615 [Streptomyces sp. NPDC006476]|jgi:hypothetical protein|uniref:hypothetical protein n=1 Tax=Streptomyces sp. NPDC006476 TaxID=3157175 RepID=UPI0033B2FED1
MNSSEYDRLPVYDSLVRERGDVVTETREVAERAQHQAREALSGHTNPPPGHPQGAVSS